MKVNVRGSVWETNSSMTHSCVILPEDKYKEWEDGLFVYTGTRDWMYRKLPEKDQPIRNNLYTICEVQKFISDYYNIVHNNEVSFYDYADGDYADDGFYTFEAWAGGYEWDEESYTTENGEELIIRCKYGYDG